MLCFVLALFCSSQHFRSSKLKVTYPIQSSPVRTEPDHLPVSQVCPLSAMDPANIIVLRDRVFGLTELSDKIFSYLDFESIKAACLVSR